MKKKLYNIELLADAAKKKDENRLKKLFETYEIDFKDIRIYNYIDSEALLYLLDQINHKELIEHKINLIEKKPSSLTPELFKKLADLGYDYNFRNKDGDSILSQSRSSLLKYLKETLPNDPKFNFQPRDLTHFLDDPDQFIKLVQKFNFDLKNCSINDRNFLLDSVENDHQRKLLRDAGLEITPKNEHSLSSQLNDQETQSSGSEPLKYKYRAKDLARYFREKKYDEFSSLLDQVDVNVTFGPDKNNLLIEILENVRNVTPIELELIKKLIDKTNNINYINENGDSPLSSYIRDVYGTYEYKIIEYITKKQGFQMQLPDLYALILNKQLDQVIEALSKDTNNNFDLKTQINGKTILSAAQKNKQLTALLLEKGAIPTTGEFCNIISLYENDFKFIKKLLNDNVKHIYEEFNYENYDKIIRTIKFSALTEEQKLEFSSELEVKFDIKKRFSKQILQNAFTRNDADKAISILQSGVIEFDYKDYEYPGLVKYVDKNTSTKIFQALFDYTKYDISQDVFILERCLKEGNLELFEFLVNNGAEMNNPLSEQSLMNILHNLPITALEKERIENIISSKITIEYQHQDLILLIEKNNITKLKTILENSNFDLNSKFNYKKDYSVHENVTLLNVAIMYNASEIIEYLLYKGVNISSVNMSDIYKVVQNNNPILLKKILELRPDIDITNILFDLSDFNRSKSSLLKYAKISIETIETLVNAGASVNSQNNESILYNFVFPRYNTNSKEQHQVVEFITSRPDYQYRAFDILCFYKINNIEKIDYILNLKDIDINIKYNGISLIETIFNSLPVIFDPKVRNNINLIVGKLLDKGLDITEENGKKLLFLCAKYCDLEIVKSVFSKVQDKSNISFDGQSILHVALKNNPEIYNFLKSQNISSPPNCIDSQNFIKEKLESLSPRLQHVALLQMPEKDLENPKEIAGYTTKDSSIGYALMLTLFLAKHQDKLNPSSKEKISKLIEEITIYRNASDLYYNEKFKDIVREKLEKSPNYIILQDSVRTHNALIKIERVVLDGQERFIISEFNAGYGTHILDNDKVAGSLKYKLKENTTLDDILNIAEEIKKAKTAADKETSKEIFAKALHKRYSFIEEFIDGRTANSQGSRGNCTVKSITEFMKFELSGEYLEDNGSKLQISDVFLSFMKQMSISGTSKRYISENDKNLYKFIEDMIEGNTHPEFIKMLFGTHKDLSSEYTHVIPKQISSPTQERLEARQKKHDRDNPENIDKQMVQVLNKRNQSSNVMNFVGIESKYTLPVHIAALNGNLDEFIRLIQEKPEDITKMNKDNVDLLNYAIRGNNIEIVKYILEHHKDKFNLNNQDQAYLLYAKTKEILELLESNGADINFISKRGNNCLTSAIISDYLEQFKYLIARDIYDLNHKNNEGKTALDLAKEKNNTEMITILEEAIAKSREQENSIESVVSKLAQVKIGSIEDNVDLEATKPETDKDNYTDKNSGPSI